MYAFVLLAALAAADVSAAAGDDVVVLRADGVTMVGKVRSRDEENLVLHGEGWERTLPWSELERVTRYTAATTQTPTIPTSRIPCLLSTTYQGLPFWIAAGGGLMDSNPPPRSDTAYWLSGSLEAGTVIARHHAIGVRLVHGSDTCVDSFGNGCNALAKAQEEALLYGPSIDLGHFQLSAQAGIGRVHGLRDGQADLERFSTFGIASELRAFLVLQKVAAGIAVHGNANGEFPIRSASIMFSIGDYGHSRH